MTLRTSLAATSAAALAIGATFLSGCGASTATSSIQLRAVNTVGNGGDSTVTVNGLSFTGVQAAYTSQTSQSWASNYASAPAGSDVFKFDLVSTLSTASYASVTSALSAGTYSAIVMGDASVTNSTTNGYPQVIVVSNAATAPPAGYALVRFVNAAPGTESAAPDGDIDGTAVIRAIPYTNISSYAEALAGTHTMSFVVSGTTTQIAPSEVYTLVSGHQYTIYLLQLTPGSPTTYGIGETDDTLP